MKKYTWTITQITVNVTINKKRNINKKGTVFYCEIYTDLNK